MGASAASSRTARPRRRPSDLAQRQLRFLAEASNVLASSLDLDATLQQAARLTVPILADACIIYQVEGNGESRAVAVAHVNPADEAVLWELQQRYPDPASARGALGRVLATGTSVYFPDSDPAARLARARDAQHRALLERLATRSAMIVPLRARGTILGALSLMTSVSGRQYGPADVAFAEDLAGRCALAVDNARLYRAAQREIEQRLRAEAALTESEERYRLMVDQATDIVYRTDERARLVFINPVASSILGFRPEAVVGRPILDLVRPDQREAAQRFYKHQFAACIPSTYYELPMIAADGSERWLGQNVQLVVQGGRPVGLQAIARDITEPRKIQGALATLQTLSASIAAAPTPAELAEHVVDELCTRFGYELPSVYLMQPDGKLHLAAQRGYPQPITEIRPDRGITGRVVQTAQGVLIEDVDTEAEFVAAAPGIVAEACVPIVKGGAVLGLVNIETRRRGVLGHHDVHLLTALAELMAVSLENARLLRAAQDEIADRRRAEEALRVQRDFDRQVLDTMGQGLLVTDRDGRLTYANPALARMAQCAPAELQGRRLVELISADGQPARAAPMAAPCLEGDSQPAQPDQHDEQPATGPAGLDGERCLVRADGSALPVLISTARLEAGPQAGGLIAVITDLTERKRAEAAQAELLRTKQDLAAMVSHELRSPASVLIGHAELLAEADRAQPQAQTLTPTERHEILATMLDQGQRLMRIMDDFLELQRVEAPGFKVRPVTFDPRPALESAVRSAQLQGTHVVRLQVPPTLPAVLADPARFEQILANLLSNARKYSPGASRIDLEAAVRGPVLEIAVRDYGLGIPSEALPHVFEKFYRVETEDRRGIRGTGLGLAIVRELVEAQGGQIGAESAGPGQGARFWFTVPLATRPTEAAEVSPPIEPGRPAQPSEPAEPGQPAEPGELAAAGQSAEPSRPAEPAPAPAPARSAAQAARAAGATPPRGLHILTVDDEAAVGAMLRRVLRRDGHQTQAVTSAAAALDALATHPFDVVISDLGLGAGSNGLELAQQVRRRWPDTRFILASGSIEIGPAQARAHGVDAVIEKPYHPDTLRGLLDAFIAPR